MPTCGDWMHTFKQYSLNPEYPPLSNTTFKSREREVGKVVERVAKDSCHNFLNIERRIALKNGITPDQKNLVAVACSYDMGSQKQGKGHNSSTGQGAVMGLQQEKC